MEYSDEAKDYFPEPEDYQAHADRVLKEMGIEFKAEYMHRHLVKREYSYTNPKYFPEGKRAKRLYQHVYRVTLSRADKSMTVKFNQSVIDSAHGLPPSAYSVLACLTKYEPGTIRNFIEEFGYDDYKLRDYPKVLRIYRAVVREWCKVSTFFTPEELSIIQEIQ